jgi:hypothetical protein
VDAAGGRVHAGPAGTRMSTVVFLGPTLSQTDAEAVLPATYRPPVRQGDVYRLVRDEAPRAIGIIDGGFLDVASVWHREILWALSQGVHVFGAASMGALRAAELDGFGMRGIGRIYAAYRDGYWPGYDEPFEDDDEVAVIHAPPEAGGRPQSDAMVDLRDTLLAAEAAGVIDRPRRDALTVAMKRLHFADRGFGRLADAAGDAAVRRWLLANQVRRKRLDAIAMLAAMQVFLADDPPPFQAMFRFERALVWEQFVAAADPLDELEADVLTELRLDCRAWREVRRAALGRLHGPRPVEPAALRKVLDEFRRERGLWRRADLDAWLAANALDAARFERLLCREAALNAEAAGRNTTLPFAMLDRLRLTGRFSDLLRAVRTKQAALTDAPPPPLEPHRQAVLDWYFEQRLGLMRPTSLAAFVAEAGWEDENELMLAVWRDYLFNRIPK